MPVTTRNKHKKKHQPLPRREPKASNTRKKHTSSSLDMPRDSGEWNAVPNGTSQPHEPSKPSSRAVGSAGNLAAVTKSSQPSYPSPNADARSVLTRCQPCSDATFPLAQHCLKEPLHSNAQPPSSNSTSNSHIQPESPHHTEIKSSQLEYTSDQCSGSVRHTHGDILQSASPSHLSPNENSPLSSHNSPKTTSELPTAEELEELGRTQQLTPEYLLKVRRLYFKASMHQITCKHHLNFLKECQHNNTIPKGLRLNLKPHAYKLDSTEVSTKIATLLKETEQKVTQYLIEHYETIIGNPRSDRYERVLNICEYFPTTPPSVVNNHKEILNKTTDKINKKEKTLQERASKKLEHLIKTPVSRNNKHTCTQHKQKAHNGDSAKLPLSRDSRNSHPRPNHSHSQVNQFPSHSRNPSSLLPTPPFPFPYYQMPPQFLPFNHNSFMSFPSFFPSHTVQHP